MTDKPLVTVIICAYNAGAYLKASLDSILSQTYTDLEIIIVDDGSTDGSIEFVAHVDDSRVRLLHQENRGKPVAMNRGIDESRGDFYAVHDADDLSHPCRIQRQVEVFMANADLAAVYCGHELVMGEKHYAPRFRAKNREECRSDINEFRMPAHDPTGMYRMSMVGSFRYEPSLLIAEGYDYVVRIGEQYPMVVLGECLYSYRIHPDSLTRRDPEQRDLLVQEALRRACERRGKTYEVLFSANEPQKLQRQGEDFGIAVDFMESAVDLRRAGRYLEAIRTGVQCIQLSPKNPDHYKALIYAVLPERLRRFVRTARE